MTQYWCALCCFWLIENKLNAPNINFKPKFLLGCIQRKFSCLLLLRQWLKPSLLVCFSRSLGADYEFRISMVSWQICVFRLWLDQGVTEPFVSTAQYTTTPFTMYTLLWMYCPIHTVNCNCTRETMPWLTLDMGKEDSISPSNLICVTTKG